MGLCVLDQGCDAQEDFVAWTVAGIRHEANRLAKRKRRRAHRELLTLDVPIQDGLNGEEGRRAIDDVPGPDDTEGEALDHLALDEALDILTPAQRQVVLNVVIRDLPEHSVAQALKVSQQTANRIKLTALRKIRPYLTKGGSIDGGLL